MALKPETAGELRGMVREVLREVLAKKTPPDTGGTEAVRVGNDSELAVFIQRLMEPATLEAVRAGRLRFTLQGAPAAGNVLQGVITEQKIEKLAGSGTLLLASDAVLTPLARDKARRLGLTIERRR